LLASIEKDCLRENVANRAFWYKKHARTAKIWYRTIFISILLLNGLTVYLSSLCDFSGFQEFWLSDKSIYALISILVNILLSISGCFHFKERWIQYRRSLEFIKRECTLYLASTGEYHLPRKKQKEKNRLFTKNIERICAAEAKAWSASHDTDDKKK